MSAFSNQRDSSREKLVLHINDDSQHTVSSSPGPLHQRHHCHSAMLGKTVKTMFALVSLFLLAILCTYIGSKVIFDYSSTDRNSAEQSNGDGNGDGRKGLAPLPQNEIKDCRTSGCFNNFECVEIKVDQACFVQPCPSVVYECLPPAMLNDPADAMFSIQPASQGNGELGNDDLDSSGELTQGYFNCLQQHGGKSIWNHPDQPCNTCRCTTTGSIACTKMFCIPHSKPGSPAGQNTIMADSSEPYTLTTIMSPVPNPAGKEDSENTSHTRIDSSKNNDMDDFNFDDLDDSLLEDLLKDDLEMLDDNTAPVSAPALKPAPVIPPVFGQGQASSLGFPSKNNRGFQQNNAHTLSNKSESNGSNSTSSFYRQSKPSLQQKQQPTMPKSGQLTIDALFSKRNGQVSQQQSRNQGFGQQPESLVPAKRPASSSSGFSNGFDHGHSAPSKMPRADDIDQQLQEEIDLIEIDSDYDDLIAEVTEVTPQKPAASSTYSSLQPQHQQQQNQQQQQSMNSSNQFPFSYQKQSPFQIKELAIKNRGDNSLVERLHKMNRSAMSTYIYPLLNGQPARAYQQGAIQRCLFQNTLVALPTGMGKTLIAVVVMANYARWFPDSLSIFLAPTKPLVSQQINACRGLIRAIMSHASQDRFDSDCVIEMNGSTQPKTREKLWSTARFVFSTPQILQNDIKTSILSTDNAKRIVLLVIDEAHRAMGKYAYGMSIAQLYRLHYGFDLPMFNSAHPAPPAPFRVMSLTATPGSNMDAVRQIVRQLHVSHIFIRTEESMDVVPYIHGRLIEEIVVELPPWLVAARTTLAAVIRRSANLLANVCKAMSMPQDLMRISGYQVRLDRDRFCRTMHGLSSGMDASRVIGEFTILISLAHIMQLLSEHGLRPAWAAISQWDQEVKRAKENKGSSTRAKVDCVDSKEWATLFREFRQLVDALDGKPLSTSNNNSVVANGASSTDANRAWPAANTVKTDVVSSFFNMSGKPPQANSTNAPVTIGMSQTPVSLAHSGFLGHPKLERLREIVRAHFDQLSSNGSQTASTRIIVFSQYRGSVSEIVAVLNRMRPLVKCEPFIGQSKASGGSNGSSSNQNRRSSGEHSAARGRWNGQRGAGRGNWRLSTRGRGRGGGSLYGSGGPGQQAAAASGMDDLEEDLLDIEGVDSAIRGQSQKEQLAVLDRFRQGATNVIVATCVGEEGLDIGEVDLIINYDAPSSPIRLLQRIGRTGRARRGKVVVFLAKDTREENSYKRAQRDYKNVQSKIASGKELLLRADTSPPMLPPSLPHGQPERQEIHLTKNEIARGDAAEAAAAAAASKRGRTKKGSDVRSVGIDPSDLDEFWRLTTKYDSFESNDSVYSGFKSAVSVVDRVQAHEDQRLWHDALSGTGSRESETVARLLRRGIAWQSLETPCFRFSHSKRSLMYRRIMAALERARFSHELSPGNSDAVASGKSLFRFEEEQGPQIVAFRSANGVAENRPSRVSRKSKTAKKETAFLEASKTRKKLEVVSDDDSDLQDVAAVLSGDKGASLRAKHQGNTDFPGSASIDSSPFEDEFLFAKQSPVKTPGSCRLGGKPSHSNADEHISNGINGRNGSNSLEAFTSKRRMSGQGNLFDAIDKLIRSGKAKRTFDWSMNSVDHLLLDQAKTRGIDIKLCTVADITESTFDTSKGDHFQVPARPLAFANIGQPGTFEKLYDEKMQYLESPDQLKRSLSHLSELDGFDKLDCINQADKSVMSVDMDMDKPTFARQLCADSDVEEALQEDILAEASGWDDCLLGEMQVCSPPTQPIPESPPMHDKEDLVLISPQPATKEDRGMNRVRSQNQLLAQPEAQLAQVID
ncbi:3'-5' DNA helicase, partial [Coemansia erecta]